MNRSYEAERGLFELRRGRALLVREGDGAGAERALVVSVEGLSREVLDELRRLGTGPARLVVTRHRARAMGLEEGPDRNIGAGGDISLVLDDRTSPDRILTLASTARDKAEELLDSRDASSLEGAGLALARLGRLLPAVVSVPADPVRTRDLAASLAAGTILQVSAQEIRSWSTAPPGVTRISDALVPLEDAEDAHFLLFRETQGLLEHVAILIGDREVWPDPMPVRLHSACLTGDLFGSLRCDCGEQLRGSVRAFAARGGGVLLYLAQEGRGIGLANKLRAYALQQRGLDTVDADCTLGFGPDERQYDVAVDILRQLEIERVELFTNNPAKLNALKSGGVVVVDRQPVYGTVNRHNEPYMSAKVHRAGHLLEELLAGRPRS